MKSRDFNKDSIDTFYNSLNQFDQDSLNSAVGVSSASGSSTQDAAIIALTKQVEALVSSMNRLINSIQNGYETCGGPQAYYECQAAGGYTQEDVYATTDTYNAGGNSYQPQGGGTRAEDEHGPILTESTIRVPPLVVQSPPAPISFEIPSLPISSSFELPKRNPHQLPIPYPLRLNKEKLQDKSDIQVHKFMKMFKKLHFNISLAEALALMPKYHNGMNRIDKRDKKINKEQR
ncbi:hypothetical protein Tco_0789476 [Tanacetum coccineum]